MRKHVASKLEHVPVASYHLLRRLDEGAIESATLHGVADQYAVRFLLSRGFAHLSGSQLTISAKGQAVGEVRDERGTFGFRDQLHAPSSRPFAAPAGAGKPLSQTLRDAAENIDQLSRAHVLILIRQAIKVLELREDEPRELIDPANDDRRHPHAGH